MEKFGSRSNQWQKEIQDLIRGASGGFLFGIPLLYTMEVWWIGSSVKMVRLLLAMIFTLAIVLLLNRTAGFRKAVNTTLQDECMDTIEAFAIGLVCAGSMLILLREITWETSLSEALGKLIYESVPFTLGVALANQFLSGGEEENQTSTNHRSQRSPHKQNLTLINTFADIGSTLIGAMIIAFNIAPTDEVPMLAAAVDGLWLLGVMAASLVISYTIVFAAGFAKQPKRRQQQGLFQRPLSETVMSYLVSLVAACIMLVFFDKLAWSDPWQMWLSHSILLGLPATVGGAAGRLAV